jgi:hypothetical protein
MYFEREEGARRGFRGKTWSGGRGGEEGPEVRSPKSEGRKTRVVQGIHDGRRIDCGGTCLQFLEPF